MLCTHIPVLIKAQGPFVGSLSSYLARETGKCSYLPRQNHARSSELSKQWTGKRHIRPSRLEI